MQCLIKRMASGWALSDLPARRFKSAADRLGRVIHLLFSIIYLLLKISQARIIQLNTDLTKYILFYLIYIKQHCHFCQQTSKMSITIILVVFSLPHYRQRHTHIRPSLRIRIWNRVAFVARTKHSARFARLPREQRAPGAVRRRDPSRARSADSAGTSSARRPESQSLTDRVFIHFCNFNHW